MQSLVMTSKGLSLKELDLPKVSSDEALVRIDLAGICNTDLEIVKGYMAFEGTLGHEFVATVEKADDQNLIGKRVVVDINAACRKCPVCHAGDFHHCPNRSVIGIVNRSGAFASHLSVPKENLFFVPDNVSDEMAVFVEPLAAALEISEQIKLKEKTRILVLGDGKLGLLIAMSLSALGQKVFLHGRHPERTNVFEGLNIEYVESFNEGESFPVVVEATGNSDGFKMALGLTEPRGKLVLKSTYHEDFPFNPSLAVINEIEIIGSRCGPFQKALDLLAAGKIPVEKMIEKTFSLSEGLEAIEYAGKKGVLKVLIKP